jgi:hypothetical protein
MAPASAGGQDGVFLGPQSSCCVSPHPERSRGGGLLTTIKRAAHFGNKGERGDGRGILSSLNRRLFARATPRRTSERK